MNEEIKTFGQFVRERRLVRDMGLREFCQVAGIDFGNYSKIERGLAKPPTGERLEPYRFALEIVRGSEEDNELQRLAFIAAGRIPSSILNDKELVGKLPVMFRTLEQGKMADENLDEVYELVKEAHRPESEGCE